MKYPITLLIALFLNISAWSQEISTSYRHPRAFVHPEEWSLIKAKMEREPFKGWVNAYAAMTEKLTEEYVFPERQFKASRLAWLASNQANMYLLSGEKLWAEKAWLSVQKLMMDTTITLNPISRGLNRATVLQGLSIAYDHCYHAWSPSQRKQCNQTIFKVMQSVSANMGHSANYSIASNWMGVRYGSVLLASLVYDEYDEVKSRGLPFKWDSQKRIADHIEANVYSNGWNGESMGYFNYNWSFVGPALVALSNYHAIMKGEKVLDEVGPKTKNAIWGLATSTVSIANPWGYGIKADFSDDNIGGNLDLLAGIGLKIFPKEQAPNLQWLLKYMKSQSYAPHNRGWDLFGFLYFDEEIENQNPEKSGWRQYHDPEQGICIFRNEFKDENDIVFTYSATQKRVQGHKGPDTNTFRLIGLGVPWIIGGGRTQLVAGQTNLFPSKSETPERGETEKLGKLHAFKFWDGNSGAAYGEGNPAGVVNHRRFTVAEYDASSGAKGVFVVKDSSENGKRWRINTPEFNKVTELPDGFLLTAPNGSSLKFTVKGDSQKIQTGKLRYGGNTIENNTGIGYQGKTYSHSKFIDVFCENNITVVMTLQPEGRKHPKVKWIGNEKVRVGKLGIPLNAKVLYQKNILKTE